MKVEKLLLKNFGPFHGAHRIDFGVLGDIFLVCGKTGAGKTTIFDAIAYALYGNIPGGRKGLVKQMRCQFAESADESAVELEFSLGRDRYRVRRSLPGETTGKRSGKITETPEQVTLEKKSGVAWESGSVAKKSETDEMILALIGLSLEEFSRIILLPQGEFAQFLRLNSKDRKDVLLKLFPMEQYTRLIEEARERSRNAGLRLKDKETALAALRNEYDSASYAGERTTLLASITAREAEHAALLDSYQKQSRICEQARAADQKRTRHDELTTLLETLGVEKEIVSAKQTELDLARKAEPLLYRVEQLAAAEADRDTTIRELTSAERELAAAIEERTGFEQTAADNVKNDAKRQELRARRGNLKMAVDIATTLVREQDELNALKQRRSELLKTAGETEIKLGEFDTRLTELSGPIERLEERDRAKEEADRRLRNARTINECAADHERLTLSRTAHAGAAANTEAKIAETEKDLDIAKAELAGLELEAERAKAGDTAASLARTLKHGEPCPVCGSTEHPKPASPAAAFDTTERIDAKNRTIRSLETALEKLRKDLATHRANEQAAADRIAEICKRAETVPDRMNPETIPTPADAARALETAAKEMQAASDALIQSQKAVREAEDIRKSRTAFLAGTEATAAELDALAGEITKRETGMAFNTDRYREAFPDETVPDPAMAEEALEILDATLLELDAIINKFTDGFTAAKERCASLATRKEHLKELLARKQKDLAEIHAGLDSERAKAGFADSTAIRSAARTREQMDDLDRSIQAWNKRFTETAAEAERLEEELREWKGADAKTAEAELERITLELKSSESSLHEMKLSLSNLDARETRYQTMVAEFEELSKETGALVALAGDLTGQNPAKMSFDAWILGSYLEEITAYANTRLERMSDGRYRIQVDEQFRKGNSLAGLDLEILDAYTGKTRPAGTLSGGETFMASISLALGLADSIQTRSGGIQLDAVFIDEGFGSLDETSLEKAIGILDEIRGHRMVGLISHVPELRSRIPGRIEIIKTQTGSRIVQGEHS